MIWVQGCPIRCQGCFNKEFHEFRTRFRTDVDALTDYILEIPGIEGVTFSGGEPFAQAEALSELGHNLQAHTLNVVTYSGFPYPYLREKNRRSWSSLLRVTDLLIAGPYISGENSTHPLLASANQSLIFLSDRLRDRVESEQLYREIELNFYPEGDITVTGFPDENLCRSWGQEFPGGDVHVAF